MNASQTPPARTADLTCVVHVHALNEGLPLPPAARSAETRADCALADTGPARSYDRLSGPQELMGLWLDMGGQRDLVYLPRNGLFENLMARQSCAPENILLALSLDTTSGSERLLTTLPTTAGQIMVLCRKENRDRLETATALLGDTWTASDWEAHDGDQIGHVVLSQARTGAGSGAGTGAVSRLLAGQEPVAQIAVQSAEDSLSGFAIAESRLSDHLIEGLVDAYTPVGPLPSVMAFYEGAPVGISGLVPVPGEDDRFFFRLELPRAIYFDGSASNVELRLGVPAVTDAGPSLSLPRRRVLSAERLLDSDLTPSATGALSGVGRKPLGIVVYTFTRTDAAMQVLESLKRQGALGLVEVWMDGDQGKPAVRRALDAAEQEIRDFGVDRVTRHRGNLGFRKLILQSLSHMVRSYDRFIVLEDDCFPTGEAVEQFVTALDMYEDNPEVLTAYGHHFLTPSEQDVCARFQGWGWATWSDKFAPFLNELIYLFSLPETEFRQWARDAMTPDVLARMDVTSPRDASKTLQNFFAWDEALTLLAVLAKVQHAPTDKRCIYNFGVGEDSTHFTNIDWYRQPPFNMVLRDEIWDLF